MSVHDIVLFGPPGVGKGAQAEILSHRDGLVHLSTGEILREEIARGTELGRRVEDAVGRGEFADDETVLEIVLTRIDTPGNASGFVMDGFPRTVRQAEMFDRLLADRGRRVECALFIEAPAQIVLARLAGRLICSECGKTYHKQFRRPRIDGRCDVCKGKIVGRHDDDPEIHRERLREYRRKTAPLESYYRERGVLVEIDGAQSIDAVAADISNAIDGANLRD